MEMLEKAGDLGFKKAITIILGLGETPEDLKYLFNLIGDVEIDRVIFYSLNPHKDTPMQTHPACFSVLCRDGGSYSDKISQTGNNCRNMDRQPGQHRAIDTCRCKWNN